MNTLKSILNKEFESSCYETDEWKSAYRKSVNVIKKSLKDIAESIEISRGHFYFSGFFTAKKTGQVFYISVSDVRHFNANNMLIRTAKDYKDYTGGRNMYIRIDNHLTSDVQSVIG